MIAPLLASIMLATAAPCPQDVPIYEGTQAPCDGLLVPADEAEGVAVELMHCRAWLDRSTGAHAADARFWAAKLTACETRRDALADMLDTPPQPRVEAWKGWPWVAAVAGVALGAGIVGLAWYGARD